MNYKRHIKDLIHYRYVKEICIIGNDLFNVVQKRIEPVLDLADKEKFNLACFIKSEESIARKILLNLKPRALEFLEQETYDEIDEAFEQEMKALDDVFRMNYELEVEQFEDKVVEILGLLLKDNNDLSYGGKFKNKFSSETKGYKDLKVYLKYRDYLFEIQFHTKESNALNKKTHGIYEVFRNMEPCDDRESLKLDRDRLFEGLSVPDIHEDVIIGSIKEYGK